MLSLKHLELSLCTWDTSRGDPHVHCVVAEERQDRFPCVWDTNRVGTNVRLLLLIVKRFFFLMVRRLLHGGTFLSPSHMTAGPTGRGSIIIIDTFLFFILHNKRRALHKIDTAHLYRLGYERHHRKRPFGSILWQDRTQFCLTQFCLKQRWCCLPSEFPGDSVLSAPFGLSSRERGRQYLGRLLPTCVAFMFVEHARYAYRTPRPTPPRHPRHSAG